jgi:wyosine [tRNA(Phe)-imidazoG37] synthetase (radical SAM superfamily)
MNEATATERKPAPARRMPSSHVFGFPRDYLANRFVYLTISARARGLSIGVNLNPDMRCSFNCIYCEVDRRVPVSNPVMDLNVLAEELRTTLALVESGKLRDLSPYSHICPELLLLRHLAISGDGEPTLCPKFRGAVETVVHGRAASSRQFFKIVLITNGSHLDVTSVQDGLRLLTQDDEIWIKLDAGTQAQMDLVNKSEVPMQKILSNILMTGRQRPIVIQSLFPALNGCGPSEHEVEKYAQVLKELTGAGANISLVQIYSAARPAVNPQCGHLRLRTLSQIARTVRGRTGLNVEIY